VNTLLDNFVSLLHYDFPLTSLQTSSTGDASSRRISADIKDLLIPVLCSTTQKHHWRLGWATRHRTDTCIQRRYDLLYLCARLQIGLTAEVAQEQTASSLLDDFPVQVAGISNALDTITFSSFFWVTGLIRSLSRG
jgi:hypothetical protein